MSNVHLIAQSGFGAGTNELYDRARPSYPAQSLTFIKTIGPKSESLNIVEIGAGTGLFTRSLLSHPDWTSCIARLRAIEPSEGMRKVWAEKVTVENATIEDGTFENTAVPDGWADLIVIAQAFHWCPNHDKACTEFSRILKEGGSVVFIWNLEDRQVTPYLSDPVIMFSTETGLAGLLNCVSESSTTSMEPPSSALAYGARHSPLLRTLRVSRSHRKTFGSTISSRRKAFVWTEP